MASKRQNNDTPPYSKKQKGYKSVKQLPVDVGFDLKAARLNMPIVDFLQLMNTDTNIRIIKREVFVFKGGTQGKRQTRGNSHSLQGSLEIIYGSNTQRCRSDTICLLDVITVKLTKTNLEPVLRQLNKLIEVLFPIANSDAAYRVKVRNAILSKPWGNELLLDQIKQKGIFSISKVKKAKRTLDANNTLEYNLRNPIKIPEQSVLRAVAELKKKRTIHDKILLVQLCVGSRFVEVLFISDYSVSKLDKYPGHTYIRIYGVGKEQRESRRKNLAQYKLKNKRRKLNSMMVADDDEEQQQDLDSLSEIEPKEIIKPVLFNVRPQEIVDVVQQIRAEVTNRVSWYKTLTRDDFKKMQQLSNLYLKKAADKVFEFFKVRKTHLMRKIYAGYSFEQYGKTQMSQLGWFKAVLGHNSSITSRAYSNVVFLPIVQADEKAIRAELGSVKTSAAITSEQIQDMQTEIKELYDLLGGFKKPPMKQGYVHIWNKQEQRWITLQKKPDRKVSNRKQQFEEYVKLLKTNGLTASQTNLRKLGFGGSTISKFYKKKVL